jgi:hypothetical protein
VIAVDRAAGGVDEAADRGVAGSGQDVQEPGDVAGVAGQGILDGAWHRAERSLMKHILNAATDPLAERGIAEVAGHKAEVFPLLWLVTRARTSSRLTCLPVEKLSRPTTRWFSLSRVSTRFEPMNPAAPVTNQVRGIGSAFLHARRRSCGASGMAFCKSRQPKSMVSGKVMIQGSDQERWTCSRSLWTRSSTPMPWASAR